MGGEELAPSPPLVSKFCGTLMVSAGPMVAKNLLSNVKCSVDANDNKKAVLSQR